MKSRIVSETFLNGAFKKVGEFEELNSKDVSDFSESELLDIYKALNCRSVNTLQNYNNYLKSYCVYVAQQTGKEITLFENINKQVLKECISEDVKRNKYITYKQLCNIEMELLNYTDMAIMECLWLGIAGKKHVRYHKHSQRKCRCNTYVYCFAQRKRISNYGTSVGFA